MSGEAKLLHGRRQPPERRIAGVAFFAEATSPYNTKIKHAFAPRLVQRPVLKGQPGHGHLCEDIGDGAGIVLDIDAPADIGRGVAHTIASDDRAANIDRISPAARKVEGSFGNDDTFKVDTTVEFDVAVDD